MNDMVIVYMEKYRKYFHKKDWKKVQKALWEIEDESFFEQYIPYRQPKLMLLISIFFGLFGLDRLLLDQTGMGLCKLFTLGGFCLWWIYDWFAIMRLTKQYNYDLFMNRFWEYH